jgi:hypothetical protein
MLWVIVVVLLTTPAYGQSSAPAVSNGPVEGLKGSLFKIPPMPPVEATPTFKLRVEGQWPLETPLEAIRRELGADTKRMRPLVPGTAGGAPPLVTVDLLAVYGSIKKSIQQARHEHAEREARQFVAEDLAPFCAINDCSHRDEAVTEGVIIAPSSAVSPR